MSRHRPDLDPARPSPEPDQFDYEPLKPKQLQALVDEDAIPLLAGGPEIRLSLAGAQDRIPVAVFDGKLYLPEHGAPSTHILKLPNERYPHLPANEAFALGLARRLGFGVAEAELLTRTNPPSLLVTRYDRVRSGESIERLHQEDLCQAMGLPPTKKYEAEGGPGFARAVSVIRDNVDRPLVDVPRVIRWQAYNVVIGNSDGDAKNLSILYSNGTTQLSPFYDLVSTREYKTLARTLAMGIGGRANSDEIGAAQWRASSANMTIGERAIRDFVREVAQQTLDVVTDWTREFREAYGNLPVLQTLPAATSKRARRVLRSLDA